VAVIAAIVVIGAASIAMGRSDRPGTPVLAAAAGAAAGGAAAVVFLVPQVDLVPDNLDGVVEIVILAVAGAAIAGLVWRRRRTG